MDNVHKLHPDNDDSNEPEGGIVFTPAERIDLPADDAADEIPDGEVIEGEILTEEESAELERPLANRGALVVRRAVTGTQVATRAVVQVGTHDRTKTAGQGRSAGVVHRRAGCGVVGEAGLGRLDAWAPTGARSRRPSGWRPRGAEGVDRPQGDGHRAPPPPPDGPAEARVGCAQGRVSLRWSGVPLLVLVIAILTKVTGNGSFTGVWLGFFGLDRVPDRCGARSCGRAVRSPLPFLVVLAAWREGASAALNRRAWLVTTADADVDVAIDETTIAKALEALRIPAITQYLKAGLKLQFITPARVDGRGTHAVVRLPAGVTAEKIARRRGDLATGLHRAAKEVWPTTGSEAGILDLWIADKGALAEGAGEYPLLADGLVDVFKGVPVGQDAAR